MTASDQPDSRLVFITREEASQIALAAAKEAARTIQNETFALLGINLSNFDSMEALRDDLEWARRGRMLSQATGAKIWTTIVGIGAAGIALAVWEAIHTWIIKP